MRKFLIVIFAFMAHIYAAAQVAGDRDSMILDKIKLANEKYASITSDFRQSKHIAHMKEDIVSQGRFFFEKPDKLALQYTVPAGDLMLMNGDKCVMSSAGKITRASLKSSAKIRKIKAILSASLKGDVREMNAKKITCGETDQYFIVSVEINEKGKSGVISKVAVSYNKADCSPSILRTEEPDGSFTVYELIDKKHNQEIDAAVFDAKNIKK